MLRRPSGLWVPDYSKRRFCNMSSGLGSGLSELSLSSGTRGATGGGGAGFSLIAHAIAGALAAPVTSAIDTTGANLLVVPVSQFKGFTAGTLTDSKGNTWTGLTAKLSGTNAYNRIFYCASPIVGSGHTFTFSNGGNIAGAIAVQAWSGANGSPFDVENGATTNGATSLQTGSVTPNQNNSLIVASACITDNSVTYTIDSGFTETDEIDWGGGAQEGLGMAYLVQGSAAAVNPTWSWVGSAEAAATIAVFKP